MTLMLRFWRLRRTRPHHEGLRGGDPGEIPVLQLRQRHLSRVTRPRGGPDSENHPALDRPSQGMDRFKLLWDSANSKFTNLEDANAFLRREYRPYPWSPSAYEETAQPMVVRGGSFLDRSERARASFRLGYERQQPVFDVGFRVICDAGPAPSSEGKLQTVASASGAAEKDKNR